MDKINFIIPGKPEYLTMVRLAIGSIASNAGFNLEEIEDIKTAVCEACKYVSCHGFNGFSEKYEVECNAAEGLIEIIVQDDCDCHSLEKKHKPCKICPSEGDLGVYVVETLMNEVEFGKNENDHKFVKMVKKA
ncbi:MAG: ATP-binding protein [Hornefia sp.]|nr:ATP-binding protein [Hornefia sp.]